MNGYGYTQEPTNKRVCEWLEIDPVKNRVTCTQNYHRCPDPQWLALQTDNTCCKLITEYPDLSQWEPIKLARLLKYKGIRLIKDKGIRGVRGVEVLLDDRGVTVRAYTTTKTVSEFHATSASAAMYQLAVKLLSEA